ncbi:MAG: ATP-binding protein [Streptomyces sp.]|nr:ATP-binding protein [Streptomyces sp.]
MQTRTKKTLATGVLGLAFAAAAAGSASASVAPVNINGFPIGNTAGIVPDSATSAAQNALAGGAQNALAGGAQNLLPSGNEVVPVHGLIGGIPLGG